MKIEWIELRQIAMELVEPFETSGWRETVRPCIIIALRSEGLTGYGECVAGAGPWYSYETVETAWHILKDFLIPAVLGKDLSSPEELHAQLRPIRGHPMAKAGLEAAFWDVLAQAKGISLAQLLGGTKERIESGISIGIQKDIPTLLEVIEHRRAQGYKRIKLKVKPGWDLEVLRSVRQRFPDIELMADANAAYRLADREHLRKFDDFGLVMLEQPLDYDDLIDHAALQRELKTPICLDESIKTPDDARKALDIGACRIINIKPGRVGGLLNAKKIHDLCRERGVPVWCGGMLETGIGRAANVAHGEPARIYPPQRYLRERALLEGGSHRAAVCARARWDDQGPDRARTGRAHCKRALGEGDAASRGVSGMILKTIGFILRAIKFRESDLILTVLSRDYGKISLIAKGARRTESKFGAALDLLTLSELVFYDAENLKLLKEASILEDYRALKGDYDRLTLALQTAHLLNQLVEEHHPDRAVFEFFKDFLEALGSLRDLDLAALAVKLKLTRALGIAPRMSSCARCAKTPLPAPPRRGEGSSPFPVREGGRGVRSDEIWFSPQSGGFVCGACHQAGDTRLPLRLAQNLKMILGLGWDKLDRLALTEDDITLAQGVLDEFIGFHLKTLQKSR
jgi:O-succinylbenzoate synthase